MKSVISAAVVFLLLAQLGYSIEQKKITGTVTGDDGEPIVGATVVLLGNGEIVRGTSTGESGQFSFRISSGQNDYTLRISSVGYQSKTVYLDNLDEISIILNHEVTEVEGISVRPRKLEQITTETASSWRIEHAASTSLVPDNPFAALNAPQVSRAGSSHSSTLRVNGTSPVYTLNGLPIGTDPVHYGTFAILPSSMVERMTFSSLGSSAAHRLPVFVDLETPSCWKKKNSGTASLSTVSANLSYAVSNNRGFAVVSARQSVLDRLVNSLDVQSDRATLPPTNFQDIFVSSGVRLSREARLMVDHYRVRDYLLYNTASAGEGINGHATSQQTNEQYYAVRLELLSGPLLAKANLSSRKSSRNYSAVPVTNSGHSGLYLDVGEEFTTHTGQLSVAYELEHSQVEVGAQVEADVNREYNLDQTNWNFLPPFAASDNPYIYQQALNKSVGTAHGHAESRSTSVYGSWTREWGKLETELGSRIERFDQLANGSQLLYRSRISYDLGKPGRVSFFAGTFAYSPIDNVLEPYQVLIRKDLSRLTPVSNTVVSLSYQQGPVKLALFEKHVSNLPLPTPDFNKVNVKSHNIGQEFIRMQSTGRIQVRGLDLTLEKHDLFNGRVDLYAYYSFSSSYRRDFGLTIPYELGAPHRILAQVTYRPRHNVSLGSEVQVRSGYPYSPLRSSHVADETELYTPEAFAEIQSRENSRRFPINAYLNLNAQYDFGQTIVFLSVFNVTNRANPIISSPSGLIHDAGILPMLGLKYIF